MPELHVTEPDTARHEGFVAPGFEEVRAEFERNFVERGEIGAAVAAYWRGEKVVDLWGGRRTPSGQAPWNEDTIVVVNSTTKGLAAMTVAVRAPATNLPVLSRKRRRSMRPGSRPGRHAESNVFG